MLTFNDVFFAFIILGLLLIVGNAIHRSSHIWRSIFIPGSILAGVAGLLLGPEVLGAIVRRVLGGDHWLALGVFPQWVLDVWKSIPGFFINIVFATLFLGNPLPNIKQIWNAAKPQVLFSQTMAWGQYVVGILLTMLVLTPVFGVNPLAGALIEITFEGGHGTAAGLGDTFAELGFAEGYDLALGLATYSLVAGTVIGTIIINWGARTGKLAPSTPAGGTVRQDTTSEAKTPKPIADNNADDVAEPALEKLTLQVSYVALAIAVGWALLQVFIYIESVTTVRLGAPALMPYVPLFPMAMIGSIIVQLIMSKFGLTRLLDRPLIQRISSAAMDVTIAAALATLSLSVLGENWAPFVLIALTGTVWNLLCFFLLAPRMFPEYWFERGIADFGQGTGVTVTGLLLLRLADPENRSGTLETFGYKQLLFEPIVGGGIWTAAAMPLIYQFGSVPVLIFTGVLTLFWLIAGLRNGRAARAS